MINIYKYTNYRKFLKEMIESKKKLDPSLTFSKLADEMSVQRSYLSQVLNNRGSFNLDQVYLISKQLGLDEDETEYLSLLLEIERSQVKERRGKLNDKRKQIKSLKMKSEKYLDRKPLDIESGFFARYYNDPYCSLVHMFLLIPKYNFSSERLLEKLEISKEKLTEILLILEKCRLIKVQKKKILVIKENLHLSNDSYLSKTNATMFRLKAIEYQQKCVNKSDYFFTASFSSDERTREKIKDSYMDFLSKVSAFVKDAPSEDVYHLNFDLFKI